MKKMLLVGDSINLHYGPYLKELIKDEYEISSKPGRNTALKRIDEAVGGNGGDSSMVLEYIKELEANGTLNHDVFLFNCGLHDIKRAVPEEKHQVPLSEYEKNLEEILNIMHSKGIKSIFITTTPVIERLHNVEIIPAGIKRYNADVCAYNAAAIRIAKKHKMPVIDLYSLAKTFTEDAYFDYAHFNPDTRKLQAAYIAGGLRSIEYLTEDIEEAKK